ncbi:hypothetical protein DIE19_34705 [Burkholderia sp. Bp9126]|nr:hypothetical protein DIE19_34705 [Burkholderia sp. Bp9126]
MNKKLDSKIVSEILQELSQGAAPHELCRVHNISRSTLYNWKKQYEGLAPSTTDRILTLEEINSNLQRRVDGLTRERLLFPAILTWLDVRVATRRALVDWLTEKHNCSVSQACSLAHISRSLYHYQPSQEHAQSI